MKYSILLFYKYVHITNPEELKNTQRAWCEELGLKGRIIVAHEGINATVEGSPEAVQTYCDRLKQDERFADVDLKISHGTGKSFPRLSVKVRNEIVSTHLGHEDVDPNKTTGYHMSPDELNKLYEKEEDFVVVDMRNNYEYKVGHFRNSFNPGMANFRDLPKVLPKLEKFKDKKVITVCTGGVRCEKASGYLIKKGFKNVSQLNGGMARYMEKYGNKDFLGKLYVFDGRILMGGEGQHEVVGKCDICGTPAEEYTNCKYDFCHAHILVCPTCKGNEDKPFCSALCKVGYAKQMLNKKVKTKTQKVVETVAKKVRRNAVVKKVRKTLFPKKPKMLISK